MSKTKTIPAVVPEVDTTDETPTLINVVAGLDFGTSGMKITDHTGSRFIAAQLARVTRDMVNVAALEGSKTRGVEDDPLRITFNGRTFLVGDGAHGQGDPVTLTLSTERLNDTEYMRAMFYAALSDIGSYADTVQIAVGLPLSVLTGPNAVENKAAIRAWMKGKHSWKVNGVCANIEVTDVWLPTQASAALLHHLNAGGIKAKKGQEFAAISIGAGTFEVEVLKYNGRGMELQPALSGSFELGTKVLLSQLPGADSYTFSEQDQRLRGGLEDVSRFVPGWWSDLSQDLARVWSPKVHNRFECVLAVGGGSLILESQLTRKFNGKLRISDEPVNDVSRGLYAYASQQANAR